MSMRKRAGITIFTRSHRKVHDASDLNPANGKVLKSAAGWPYSCKMKNLDYGVIGNCRSAALVSSEGSIDWCCLPDFDSPTVFARLLDTKIGGSFGIEIANGSVTGQRYLKNTNILSTRYQSAAGEFEVIDFMPRYKTNDSEYFTPAELYRYIRRVIGKPVIRVKYDPKFNYAAEDAAHNPESDHIRTYSTKVPTNSLFFYSSMEMEKILGGTEIELDSEQFMLLSYNQKLISVDLNRVYLEYQRTKVYWMNWANRSRKFGRYGEEIMRSLLVLKVMSFQPTGAVLAALTTSIPETIGEVRNWDYRFCWLRDASMSIDTLLKMGHTHAAKRFIDFIKTILRSKQDTFQIMYGIRGERELSEISLPHISGYENSKPVRIGNEAYRQKQNDVFGYLLNVIYQYYLHFPGTLSEIEDMWEIVRNILLTVTINWEKPDKGIWEIRNRSHHFVFSKVMSWVAFDRGAKIACLLNRKSYIDTWQQSADAVKEDVLLHGWNEELQSFTQTYDNRELDASLLLMAEYGFLDANDPRFKKTVLAVKNRLFHKGLMYRYLNPDDFGKPSSSFTICTFWLIQALHQIGKKEEAAAIFDSLLKCANHVGLFSEDIDFDTKRLLGNFPQAYSHLALIQTAILFSQEAIVSKFIKP